MDRHGVVVNTNGSIDVKLFSQGYFSSSLLLGEHSQCEFAVIDVDDSIFHSGVILLDLLESNVVVRVSTKLFIESLLVGLKIVHSYPNLGVVFFCNCYDSG